MPFYKKMYDISLPLNEKTVQWEDDDNIAVVPELSMDHGDFCNLSSLRLGAHSGTHLDAPAHFIKNGKTLEQIDLEILIGRVYVAAVQTPLITAGVLNQLPIPSDCKRVLFKTANEPLYQSSEFSETFCALDISAAEWIVKKGIQLVGIDYLSIESYGNSSYPVHRLLLSAEVAVLEGLVLGDVLPGEYQLVVLPLKLTGVEAAPVRALLFEM
jgi:arylformamidase